MRPYLDVRQSLKVLGIFLLIASLGTVCFTAGDIYRSIQSSSWPAARGRMVASAVEERQGRYGTYFGLSMRYAYSVNGVSYEGHNVRFTHNNAYSSLHEANGVIQMHPVGGSVAVFYDPNEPGLSVLQPGSPADWLIAIGIPLVTAFGGAILLLLAKFKTSVSALRG